MPDKCAIYVRVSQSGRDQTVDNQKPLLLEWARGRGFEVFNVYEEEESAWRSGHQKQLSQLVRDARHGHFKIVLVWSLDRLTREGALAILSLVHKLGGYGVKVISHQEPWTEFPSEVQEILYSLTGWVARMESQRLSERTRAGLARARREGKKLGRPKGAKDKRKRKKRSVKPVEGWTPF
jgi:DNA invertase Pin-like site-specific DNA recombinase